MVSQIVTALISVVLGIAAALVLYWVLNKAAELMPAAWEARIKPYLYILPAYAAITLYLIYPTVLTVVKSFKNSFGTEWVGLANYRQLLTNHAFQQTLVNTALWMIIVPTVTVGLGLVIATLADRLSTRGENLAKTIIFMPMAISMVGAATVWRLVYNWRSPESGLNQIGILNAALGKIGISPVAWLQTSDHRLSTYALMVILLWAQIGFSMVLLSAAVKGVPIDTLEAARIDGATELQIFFRVIVPQIRGTLVTVFITVTITVMKIFDVVYATTGGNFNTNVIGNEFFTQYKQFNEGPAAAIVVILLIAVIPIMIYQVRNFRAEEANA